MRRRSIHLALVAGILAIQFAVFEVGLRWWGGSEAGLGFQALFEPDPSIGFRLKPNARIQFTTAEFDTEIATNATGVRDDQEIGPKQPNELRIVLLGDSLVLSVQVPVHETFAELLESRLNLRSDGHRYRVINAGVQGYGPVEEALFFEDLAPRLAPDLVIVMPYVGNDAEEAYQSAGRLDPIGHATGGAASQEQFRSTVRRLVRRSMVLQILRLRVEAVRNRVSPRLAPPEPPLQSYAATPAPRIAEGLAITRRCVERIALTAGRVRARTAVALLPARFQVDDGDFGRLEKAVAEAGGRLIRDAASTRFDEALSAVPIPRTDLLPALRAALPGPDLFYQSTAHLTPRGHEVVRTRSTRSLWNLAGWSPTRALNPAMLFNSLHFVWFFIVVYAIYRVLPHRAQNWFLLAASYYFYAAWDWRFLGLLIGSTVVDYLCARGMDRADAPRRRRLLLCVSISFNLTVLGFFKYFNFFADSLHSVFGAIGWQVDFVTLRVLLPIGISFYTFATMSYVIDVYRREIPATRDPQAFALFVAYFPHLVAGPILRASQLLSQIVVPRRVTREQLRDGSWLIAWGYFQKVFVADNLAPLVNSVFDPAASPTGVNILLAAYAFAFQIYGDFAGYSNIARGTSKLMGIELIENFRFPYFVRTPQEFWRHWHISLSTWLRDYLYIPLGGNARGAASTYRNLMITMILGGLWHGAAWTFVLWGVYQGTLLVAYRAVAGAVPPARWTARPTAAQVLGVIAMFHFTCYGWLIFRAGSVNQIGAMSASLVRHFDPGSVAVQPLLVPLVMYVTPLLLVHAVEASANDTLIVPRMPVGVRYSVYSALFYCIMLFGNFGGADFIYFQF